MNADERLQIQQKNRLPHGGLINRSRTIHFIWNGRRMAGCEGDTLASALLANGVDIVGRSFKYSRPRGILTAGIEEPNAIVQLGDTPATQSPNIRATVQPLYEGLTARAVNGWPSVEFDAMAAIGKLGGAVMGPGFYYKTFMWPEKLWMGYEKLIRAAAGLGNSPVVPDADHYEHVHHHVELLIIGGGVTGLAAALQAARSGKRIMVLEADDRWGGQMLGGGPRIGEQDALDWVHAAISELERMDHVRLMRRTLANGCHDHNFVTAVEAVTDHLPASKKGQGPRQRLHKIRAAAIIFATGAHERPLVFAHNDVPGHFTASAISLYIRRWSVVPGEKLVLMTANDEAYQTAFAWQDAGREVVGIVDCRPAGESAVRSEAHRRGIRVHVAHAVIEAEGTRRVTAALIAPIAGQPWHVNGTIRVLECDTIASSGGWSPVVHLQSHAGPRPVWREDIIGFVPGDTLEKQWSAGSCAGEHQTRAALEGGTRAARAALAAIEVTVEPWPVPECAVENTMAPMAAFLLPHDLPPTRAPKQFVDYQNDVTAAGLLTAVREGFEHIEHAKRYTAMGFGTDQGKTGNINGMAIVAQARGQSIAETGTTTFRPNYAPVAFGAMSGPHVGELFDPERYTPMHLWHVDRGAEFENVGQWKRPWFYPRKGETMLEAVNRECLATRTGIGVLDASTLGKIDIQGREAREFIGRVYTNAWAKLAPGRCRYGLMCGEDGMVFDDGVTACITDTQFFMTTTSGGAARVLSHLELYHRTEWPELDVYFTSVTDHLSTISLSGPNSRQLMALLCSDIDFSAEAFKFMDWRDGTVAGIPARVYRISFTGELAYEISVPSQHAMHIWNAVFAYEKEFDITPYGTETMHVLRAEKGFIIVGQDTDGSVTPEDLDHGWAVSMDKPFSWIGKRGMLREDCLRENRKQLVGLKTTDPARVIPEGAQALNTATFTTPASMQGHVSSSYYSANLGHSIAMALIKGGLSRMGEKLYFPLADGEVIEAKICSPRFLDPEGKRQQV